MLQKKATDVSLNKCESTFLSNNRHSAVLIEVLQASPACPSYKVYRGADKSLARRTSRFILFDGENISFDATLVIYRVGQK